MKYISLFILFIFFHVSAFSQEMPEDKVDWTFSVEQNGCDATIVAHLEMDEGWHINATSLPEDNFGIPTTLEFVESSDYNLVGGIQEPKPIEEYDEVSEENLKYHIGTVELRQKIKVNTPSDFKLDFEFGFQPCDSVKCLFPFSDDFSVNVKGCESTSKLGKLKGDKNGTSDERNEDGQSQVEKDSIQTSAGSDSNSSNGMASSESNSTSKQGTDGNANEDTNNNTSKDPTEDKSLWWIFAISFGSGMIALVTPCVFPMIPMTVSFFTKQSKTKTQGISNAIKYGLSIIVIYIVLGVVVTWAFGAESLNAMATNPTFNIIFFAVLVIFAVSFMGAFEIRLPSSWANKADQKADKGGMIGIFFMALALALVSFSCTGPIVGALLFQAAAEGGFAPFVGMFGFSLALALPFALFAAFPGWMNSLPKSGGWLNVVKVVLGFLELAFAFKFLSNADMALQTHFLEREVFLAIWIGIFIVLAMYLLGKLRLPLDSPIEKLSVGRTLLGTFAIVFVIYLIPGMWGAPLKIISAFPPPMSYSESPMGVGAKAPIGTKSQVDFVEGTHLGPQNIMVFHEYDKAIAHAKKVGKPLFLDFTGHTCVNCRRMEQSVWGEPGILEILRDKVVIVSLYVDERVELPEEDQKMVTYPNGREDKLETVGQKWSFKQISEYQIASQPYYIMQNTEGEDLPNGSADYENHSEPEEFRVWLENGLNEFKKGN